MRKATKPGSASKTCFVIAPIGDEGSEARRLSDQVLKYIVRPAAKECGYRNVVRADQMAKPGMITAQVIQTLIDAELVIADLTGHNPNVFYELAIRHAIRKPVVQLIHVGHTIPFDIAQSRTVFFDARDLDSVDRCRQEVVRQIRAVELTPTDVDTPVSVAVDLQALRRSENPLEKSSAEILSILQHMQGTVEALYGSYRASDALARLPEAAREELFTVLGQSPYNSDRSILGVLAHVATQRSLSASNRKESAPKTKAASRSRRRP